jgi:hypothetical protein
MGKISDSQHPAPVKRLLLSVYCDVIDQLVFENGSFQDIATLRDTVEVSLLRYASEGESDRSQLFRYAVTQGKALARNRSRHEQARVA